MDQNDPQKLQTLHKCSKYHLLKKSLRFLLSLSLFSFLLFYPLDLSSFHHSIQFYFRKFILPLFTHTIERKYVFLICTGIVAFVGSSFQVGSDRGKDGDGGKSASQLYETQASVVDKEKALASNGPLKHVAEKALASNGPLKNVATVAEEQEQEQENGSLNTGVDESGALRIVEDIEKEEEESRSLITTEDAAAAAAKREEEFLNTEELNKKFDEFIRRMKEELRIEAQRQPIAV